MNAITHTDAELLALATDCEAAERRADETGDALIEAEEKRGAIDIPPALFRTARDRELGLFIGPDKKAPYDKEEITGISALCRRIGRQDVSLFDADTQETHHRCMAILAAWKSWREATKAADARSGYADAFKADCAAMDAFEDLKAQLVVTPASTLAGMFAKARALKLALLDDEGMAAKIQEELEIGAEIDNYLVALSLARDVLALSQKEHA